MLTRDDRAETGDGENPIEHERPRPDDVDAMALARWQELQEVGSQDRGERRFRRRAFERARDRALQALAMRLKPWMLTRNAPGDAARSAP